MQNVLKYLIIMLLGSATSTLLFADIGVLTIPGIIMALISIYFIYKENYAITAMLTIITASGSFIAQSYTAFCVSCTMAATLFALAGIFSLIQDKGQHVKLAFTLVLVLIFGVYSLNSIFDFYQNPIIEHDGIVLAKTTDNSDKPLLYVSPTCSSCNYFLDLVVKYDPKGEKCTIVTTPIRTLAQVEGTLKEKGYAGEIVSSAQSPTGFVPVLIVDGKSFRGKEIENYIKGESR